MSEPARKIVRFQEWPNVDDFREAMDSFSHRIEELQQRVRGLEEEMAGHLDRDDRETAAMWDRIGSLENAVKGGALR